MINIAEILKKAPSGIKLYSIVSGTVTFKEIRGIYSSIIVLDHNNCEQVYDYRGYLTGFGIEGECVLFPSKENRDWNKFKYFKTGSIIVDNHCVYIYKDTDTALACLSESSLLVGDIPMKLSPQARCAYDNEKDLFIKTLTKRGYFWTGLEVIKIPKKGDIICSGKVIGVVDFVRNDAIYFQVFFVNNTLHHCGTCSITKFTYAYEDGKQEFINSLKREGYYIDFIGQVRSAFNPKSFKPYDKVLVRSSPKCNWRATFFSHMSGNQVICCDDNWPHCIPYDEHLVGTIKDCEDYYKWWE